MALNATAVTYMSTIKDVALSARAQGNAIDYLANVWMPSTLIIAALAALTGIASAATSVSDSQMTTWLNGGGTDLAFAYAPIWFFGQSQNQPPCIPTWAFGGSPSSSDTYDNSRKTPASPQCSYPNVGCSCRNPGVGIGNPAPPFPIYFSYAKCNDNEVRVAYNLFYQKDGAQFGDIATGHEYDWERVVVVHRKSGTSWSPAQALLSQHSGYDRKNWGDIQNTLTTSEVNSGAAKTPNGVKNQDHPKVYISWSKHANFHDRNTGYNDALSQSTNNAFRSQDWWYFVQKQYYIRADGSTAAGRALGSADWGSANSNPLRVHEGLCSI